MTAPAILLLSGGLDSATAGGWAKRQGYALHALSLDYGQRHRVELDAARRVGQHLGVVDHKILALDLRMFGGSALTDSSMDVPMHEDVAKVSSGSIPSTYVPARNTIFLSVALGYAEVVGADAIVLGVNALDYSGYPDCRPEYLAAFETMANLATARGVSGAGRMRLMAPLVSLTKAGIIRLAGELGVDLALTHSCYAPDAAGRACGHCDSCLLRKKGFIEAGVPDPTRYAP